MLARTVLVQELFSNSDEGKEIIRIFAVANQKKTLISVRVSFLQLHRNQTTTNMSEIKYFTPEGLQKLKDELDDLILRERPRIVLAIQEARDKGDLSENAEYDAAKEAQGLLEAKIAELQDLIFNARILDESKMDNSKVLLYSNVKIKNVKSGMMMSYAIVPEKEANFKEGKLSINSPIGQGLLGKQVGDVAEIQVPAGKVQFEIVEITR